MANLNKAMIIGHLGRDPESKITKSGDTVATFSVATAEKWKDKSGEKQEKTTWHNVVAFGKLGEICAEYLTKGSLVYIEGRIDIEDYEAKDGTKKKAIKIVASTMQMLGGKPEREESAPRAQRAAARPKPPAQEAGQEEADFDDDVPF